MWFSKKKKKKKDVSIDTKTDLMSVNLFSLTNSSGQSPFPMVWPWNLSFVQLALRSQLCCVSSQSTPFSALYWPGLVYAWKYKPKKKHQTEKHKGKYTTRMLKRLISTFQLHVELVPHISLTQVTTDAYTEFNISTLRDKNT